ncbi:hypothetical protein Tco_1343749 [Tanacetum coccineum]
MASVEVESVAQTVPETVVTKEVEEINTTPAAAEAPKEAEPIVATPEPVAEETATVDAPPPPAEEAIAETQVETKEVLEEPKEETPVKEEAETTETVVEESKEETADEETPEPLKEEEKTAEVDSHTRLRWQWRKPSNQMVEVLLNYLYLAKCFSGLEYFSCSM